MARVARNEDPDQLLRYMDARADLAERYAAEGRSPDEIEAQRSDGRLLRLLIAMVIAIALGGFVISIVGILITGGSTGG